MAKLKLSGYPRWRRFAKRWNASLEIFWNTKNKPSDYAELKKEKGRSFKPEESVIKSQELPSVAKIQSAHKVGPTPLLPKVHRAVAWQRSWHNPTSHREQSVAV